VYNNNNNNNQKLNSFELSWWSKFIWYTAFHDDTLPITLNAE